MEDGYGAPVEKPEKTVEKHGYPSSFVIPANVGIHVFLFQRQNKNSWMRGASPHDERSWMPACAGMTKRESGWTVFRPHGHDEEDRLSACAETHGACIMQQQISVITLGIADLARSRRFYCDGFGWTPVFQNDEIVFYQMNGLMLGTWLAKALEGDMRRSLAKPGAFALAHNVATRDDVQPTLDRLERFGGCILRPADAPPHGGVRGYIADPDDHAWEIAWNPAWPISPEGHVTFGL